MEFEPFDAFASYRPRLFLPARGHTMLELLVIVLVVAIVVALLVR